MIRMRFLGLAIVAGLTLVAGQLLAADTPAYDDPAQLQLLITNRGEPYFLVDVRTQKEYEQGHIPTAVNIAYDVIAAHPPTADKDALIIVYCASGIRSARAKKTLEALGYLRVVDFGPISRWQGSSIPGSDPGDCPCRVPLE